MRIGVYLLALLATCASIAQSTSQVSNVKEAAAFATATSKSTATSTSTTSKGGWLAPIIIKGNKFFDSKTGTEFRLKGMAYYPRPNGGKYATESNVDWFTDEHEAIWKPDLAVMKDLGINTIRLYSVDPSQSHDKFMCAAAQAGMYVIVGMVAPCENCAILDLLPPACYPDELFTRMQMVYNAFAVYDNTLGFSIANENNLLRSKMKGGGQTMPCAKALLRDTRNYASSCASTLRNVPIGIDLADIPLREQWFQYMDCAIDNNEFTRSEWIGFNPYVECDPILHPTYKEADGLIKMMKEYNTVQYGRPVMFGEFGCVLGKNTVDGYENQRAFNDAKWMNTESDMMQEIVGGNVFEFVTEVANTVSKVPASKTQKADNGRYGVGYYSPDDCDHETIPCVFKPYPEYNNLKNAYTTTPASTLTLDTYTIDRIKILDCPSNISTTLQPMPKVKPLSCSTAMPVCNGMKSNNGKKVVDTTPALGDKAQPSNTEPVSKGKGKHATDQSSTRPILGFSMIMSTTLSVVVMMFVW